MSRIVFVLLVMLVGCRSTYDRETSKAQEALRLAELRAEVQSVRLKRCEERRAHAITCAAECTSSKQWHKDRWNKD